MANRSPFAAPELPPGLVRTLGLMNPWWREEPSRPLPKHRRHLVASIQRRLAAGLAPIIVVRGPRQIGKSTAQNQVIEDLLANGFPPNSIFAVQFDELRVRQLGDSQFSDNKEDATLEEVPILSLVLWYEENILRRTLNRTAIEDRPALLVFDEVQNLDNWAPQLKSLVDHAKVSVLVTGSSAFRIEVGRDSLAGRITTIEAGVLSLTEIGDFNGAPLPTPYLKDNGLDVLKDPEFWRGLRVHGERHRVERDKAFALFSERGGYPVAHMGVPVAWNQIADQLNETVVERVIQHDLKTPRRGRPLNAALMREVFTFACRYAGQTPSLRTLVQTVQQSFGEAVSSGRVRSYLDLLNQSLLIRLVQPMEIRMRSARSPAKICLADHGLRTSWIQENIPIDPEMLAQRPELADLAGHIVESVVGACLSTIPGLDISYFPARRGEPEVDFVITIGVQRIPIEIKYRRHIDPKDDCQGLRSFIEKRVYNAPFGILVTQADDRPLEDSRIINMPLSSFLLLR